MKILCETGFKISIQDQKALDHYLNQSPKEWAELALKGMINKALKTIIRDYIEIYKSKNVSIPANIPDLVVALIALDEFKAYKRESSETRKANRKTPKDIEVWSGGFPVEDWEKKVLDLFYKDIEQQLMEIMENKISLRKTAFCKEGLSSLFRDKSSAVANIPSHDDDFIDLVTGKPGYMNRKERDAIALATTG